jgi:hypothetical protein
MKFLEAENSEDIIAEPSDRRFGLTMASVFVNPFVMAIIFFLAILPIGLTMRLFGKDFLRLKWDRTLPTYWLPRTDPRPPSVSMRQQF